MKKKTNKCFCNNKNYYIIILILLLICILVYKRNLYIIKEKFTSGYRYNWQYLQDHNIRFVTAKTESQNYEQNSKCIKGKYKRNKKEKIDNIYISGSSIFGIDHDGHLYTCSKSCLSTDENKFWIRMGYCKDIDNDE